MVKVSNKPETMMKVKHTLLTFISVTIKIVVTFYRPTLSLEKTQWLEIGQ